MSDSCMICVNWRHLQMLPCKSASPCKQKGRGCSFEVFDWRTWLSFHDLKNVYKLAVEKEYCIWNTHQSFLNTHFDSFEGDNRRKMGLWANDQQYFVFFITFLGHLRICQTCQHPSHLVDCMQTLPFSLHLSKHVALFRRFVSGSASTFFRTPGNQPSEVFLQPQNVTFSFPQGDVFRAVAFIPTSP